MKKTERHHIPKPVSAPQKEEPAGGPAAVDAQHRPKRGQREGEDLALIRRGAHREEQGKPRGHEREQRPAVGPSTAVTVAANVPCVLGLVKIDPSPWSPRDASSGPRSTRPRSFGRGPAPSSL